MAQHEFGHGKRIENSTDPPNSLRKHVRVATHTRRNAYACSIPDLPRSEHLRHYRVLQCTKRSRSMTRTHVSGDFYVRRAQGFHEQRHCTGGRWAVALQGHFRPHRVRPCLATLAERWVRRSHSGPRLRTAAAFGAMANIRAANTPAREPRVRLSWASRLRPSSDAPPAHSAPWFQATNMRPIR